MSIIQGNAHTSAGGGYQIQRSLRFNSADSAYLNRTLSSSGNRKTWTWSGWVKGFTTGNALFGAAGSSGGQGAIYFSNSSIVLYEYSVEVSAETFNVKSSAVYRDPAAWYHIVAAFDTTQATASNRIKLYVNGVQITAFATANYPSLNLDAYNINNSTKRALLGTENYGGSGTMNGLMTEVNFIDGQALTPSDFGETDSATGVWKPKAYSGTYGTNGFFLKFADNSGTTSTTLGKDSSGNGNNWTPNNFSVTAGAGNDSLVDSPTAYGTDTGVGGEVRGNYATWNPLATTPAAPVTFSNGNLDVSFGSSLTGWSKSSIAVSSGKWYAEITVTAASDANMIIGIVKPETYIAPGDTADSYGYLGDGRKYTNGTGSSYGASWTTNDIIGVALNMDAGSIVFYKNGVSQGTAFTGISGTYVIEFADTSNAGTRSIAANFGQRAFAYTAPSGFKALCTTNLPTPTIGATSTTQANDYFDATVYTGTGSALTVTNSGMQPDLVWIKNRTSADSSGLWDAIRGVNQRLISNLTNAEDTSSGVSAFNSNGFSVGTAANYNTNGNSFIAWQWNAGGSNATNTSGTITSTVRANTTSGFSIVTYTGNGSANQTVGHGLGVAPAFGILKDRDSNSNNDQWQIFHTGAGDKYGYFTTAAFAGTAEFYPTSGSSTTVTIARGSPAATTNESGDRYVMYLFAPVAGYSAFGSYTGNGSSDGPFVFTNFRPRFVFWKNASTTGDWQMKDAARSTYNVTNANLYANLSNAENSAGDVDFLSNGFKIRSSGTDVNGSGNTIIYAAFAETPAKFSLAR